jgi:hypothetical protein
MANADFMAYLQGRRSGFNPYSAGNKQYGGGRNAPNVGPTSAQGQAGYNKRDAEARRLRNAMLRRMQARQSGNYASAAAQRPLPKGLYPGPGGF